MPLDDVKTLAERILRLEQKLQRLEKREGRPSVELFDNSAIRNRKIIDDLLVHNHVHADLLGLDADDHTQYLNITRHDVTSRHTLGTVVPHDSHSSLSNLSSDDHTQYLNTTRHDSTTRHTLGTVVPHDDHGQLTGLADDDHTQYTKHPASSTDNAIVRWDGTGGRTLQNSSVAIDDNGKLSGDGLDGWIYDTDTWSYVSATSFKVSGKDVRYKFPKGTKIKLVQTSTKYFYVVATAYSTDTTVTITGGSDYTLASATISGQAYSYATAPQGFPQWFNFTPTLYTGWSALPTGTYIFKIIGRICIYLIDMSAGTSNGTSAELSIPVVANKSMNKGGVNGYAVDNGSPLTVATRWIIAGTDNKVVFYTNMAVGNWTNINTKRIRSLIMYEI